MSWGLTRDEAYEVYGWDILGGGLCPHDGARRKRVRRLYPRLVERDGEVCAYCGTVEDLSVDHVVPMVRGGSDDLENLQILCRPCNRRKGPR